METNLATSKKELRKKVLQTRCLMSQKEWEEKSNSIYETLCSHPFFLEAKEVYCYLDYHGEVGTRRIIEQSFRLGKRVAVPKIEGNDMHFYYIESLDDVEEGYCQILEPTTEELAEGQEVLIVMPGAVFDVNRNRIGYGKGFYDRYLKIHSHYHTLALAFALQIVENIPVETHDQKPEVMITEEQIYV